MQKQNLTPATFRFEHGDISTWSAADIEGYEHLVEGADPAIATAVETGTFVIGRHAEGNTVVVDVATADELAQRTAGIVHALIGGTPGSGKSSAAALFKAMERVAS